MMDSNTGMGTGASPFNRGKLIGLMDMFLLAVIDITALLERDGARMSPSEIEDAQYVMGAATLCSANCEMLLEMRPSEAEENLALYERLLGSAENFAAAIREDGYGKGGDDVYV